MAEGPPSVFSVASRQKKLWTSFAIFYCTFTLGVGGTFLNPVLVEFSHKLNVSVDQMSAVFTVMTASYLTGALGGVVILPFLNRQSWVIGCLTLMTFPFFVIPYVETKILFFVVCGFLGLGSGGYDCAQIAWIIDIWRSSAGPFILSQHFAFSLGTLLPPLILAPFLNSTPKDVTDFPGQSLDIPGTSNLTIPFAIAAGVHVLAVLIQIGLYVVYQKMTKPIRRPSALADVIKQQQINSGEINTQPTQPQDSFKRIICLVILSCFIIGFYQGCEVVTSQFIATFAHFSKLKLSEADSARVALGLQLGFAGGRLLGILLVLKFAAHFLLMGNLVLLIGGNLILLVLGGTHLAWLWSGVVILGTGMSTVFPAVYTFVERYLFISDSIAATITVCGGLVSAVYPLVVGGMVEKNPEVLTYVNFFSIAVSVMAFLILFFVTFVRAKRLGIERTS